MLTLIGFGCSTEKSAEKRATEAAEAIISQSDQLKNLDKICRNLPVFDETEPKVKSISRKSDTLFYYYKLKIDFGELQNRLKEKLEKDGWTLKRGVNGVKEVQIEFEKGNYWIQVGYNEFTELNYSTNCSDLSKS